MNINESVVNEVAPGRLLRVAINIGNPILARIDEMTGNPSGLAVDLALALGSYLGVAADLMVFDAAAKAVKAVSDGTADVGFFAVDPLRGKEISFTAPYLLIEGCYVVPTLSPVKENAEVDSLGIRVAVGVGSAYDLYLTRTLKQAEIVRAINSQVVVEACLAQHLDVAAGVRQQLEADVKRIGGLRFLPGRFMVIEQAMAMSKTRSAIGLAVLRDFLNDMKRSGFVAERLRWHDIQGVTVAPTV